MTQALIRAINMGLYEAGWTVVNDGYSIKNRTWRKAVEPVEQHIQRRIKKAIAAEREACAQLCERMAGRTEDIRRAALEMAAENIRAREQK